MEEGILKRLMSSMKCGSCGQRFDEENVDILGNSDEMWFVQAICSKCQTQSLIVAIMQKCHDSSKVTDLTRAECRSFDATEAVDGDYQLKMHSFLKDFDGDFSFLFGGKRSR